MNNSYKTYYSLDINSYFGYITYLIEMYDHQTAIRQKTIKIFNS